MKVRSFTEDIKGAVKEIKEILSYKIISVPLIVTMMVGGYSLMNHKEYVLREGNTEYLVSYAPFSYTIVDKISEGKYYEGRCMFNSLDILPEDVSLKEIKRNCESVYKQLREDNKIPSVVLDRMSRVEEKE